MSAPKLKTVLENLKSDKATVRQQALTSIREAFDRDSSIENFDDGDGKSWLMVFWALFACVRTEKAAITKRGGGGPAAAAERRIKDAAATVRWLTERTIAYWPSLTARSLVDHFRGTMKHNGQLFAPIALDYIKALRAIFSYPPHRDHLMTKVERWIPTLSLSLAVVLGDNLNSELEDEPDDTSEAEVNLALSEDDGTPARKRRRLIPDADEGRPRPSAPRTVSPEQIEFVALIATMLSSPRCRLLTPEYKHLPGAVLNRLSRFFKVYPIETSAHLDAISAVQATLDHVALNARDETIKFGVSTWDSFLQLWSTKSRPMKESVLMVLKTLFPYVAHADASQFDMLDGFSKLLRHFHADSSLRWGFEELSLDSLRLALTDRIEEPFVLHTMKYGFNFTGSQAATWAKLELMADVIKELFLLFESSHSSLPESKQRRLENPIKSLLQTIQQPKAGRVAVHALQSLFFVIERHWSTLHCEIQLEITECLLHAITSDESSVQNWIFCCLAAIAYADALTPSRSRHLAYLWDDVWSHSMRRTNVPGVCRSACHVAHVLLVCAKVPTSRVLAEIETMTQDINVQGPSAPYDSVCAFLSRCVKVANQDTRLHRMHLDDKVLSWLIENWNISVAASRTSSSPTNLRVEQHTVQDILALAQTACGFPEPDQIFCPISLPQHAVVNLMQSQMDTAVVREFLLDARFPEEQVSLRTSSGYQPKETPSEYKGDRSQPDARVRKTSVFFLKTLESIITTWDVSAEMPLRPPAEILRRALDFAVLTICFESSLAMNGITNNRRSLIMACKLISLLAPHLAGLGWSMEELSFLLSSLAPISSEYSEDSASDKLEAFISPGKFTGIKCGKDRRINSSSKTLHSSHRQLQSTIWRSSDVQDALSSVLRSMKQILKTFTSEEGGTMNPHLTAVVDDDRDGFGPIRTANTPVADIRPDKDDQNAVKGIVRMCVDSIVLSSVLRSSENAAVKDRSLVELICDCEDVDKFRTILAVFLLHVRRGNVRITHSNLDLILGCIGEHLSSYNYGRLDGLHVTVIQFLDWTMPVWLQATCPEETVEEVKKVIYWLLINQRKGVLCSWKTRGALTQLCLHYLAMDPSQQLVVSITGQKESLTAEDFPDKLLPSMNKDEDIRVRFTAALSCASLFSTSYIRSKAPMDIYAEISEQLCIELFDYEHMLTRFVCLANIVIASSAVRRGPYWHLIETCLHDASYVKHIENVLKVAARTMELCPFSKLFESYASQIAYSIRMYEKEEKDFFVLPPNLLGYRDRGECAEATFMAFAPTNLLSRPEDVNDIMSENSSFGRHCKLLGKAPIDGLLQCFADIIGYQIVFWIDDHENPVSECIDLEIGDIVVNVSGLFESLQTKFVTLGSADYLQQQMAQKADGIICSILRTNGGLDCHREGVIVKTFESFRKPERCVRAFRALMQFRSHGEFEMHAPNVPSFSASVVLTGLDWLCAQVETANSAASTYHVMHYFFTTIANCAVINEQLRLLISLCIWISLAYSHFKNATLLRVLMSGSVMLIGQPDLATIAQGMLDWAFIHLRETQQDTPHLVEILIRICTAAREFSLSDDEATRKLGSRLQAWVEDEILSLSEVEVLRKRIAVALAAWPGVLSDRLLALRGNLNFEDLSTILDDPYLSCHKFRIVRRLSELSSSASYDRDRFARHVFWRLKDSIPTEQSVPEEIDAFTSLLVTNSGHIRNQAVDQTYGRSIATRHLKLGSQKNAVSVKRPIVQALLDLLTDQSAQAVRVAYRTLRLLAGNEPLDTMEYGTWPAEYRGDISCLDFCPVKENGNVARDLSEIRQPQFLESASRFSRWISTITTFLSSVLAHSDRFYAHLLDILADNADFAEQMFSVLIHSLLLSDQRENARLLLSEYLTKLLSQSDVDERCHRSVINLILHLRHFDPGEAKDELAYNRWLDVDFMLLSRSAIKCGAYTTALLFLELAAEYKQADDRMSEQILFDIYSHIDEPDGFYGIKTLDLQDFLIRRFHHEKQWEKAFQFHGAGFEAAGGDSRSHTGIVESLHSFGFNKLAMSTLQSMQSSSRSRNVEYQLGWRTETWDLPDPASKEVTGATLYVALRAIHRERDPTVVDDIVLRSLSEELFRLRGIGNENLAEIREVMQNLMCLAQIRRWRDPAMQDNLLSDITGANDISSSDFCSLQKYFDFSDLEPIIATRISVLHSARQKEQKEQIGEMQSDLTRALYQAERCCLLQLSEAARHANQTQVALNSILSALHLDGNPDFEVKQEFANVLWLQHERKFAVDCLKSEVQRQRLDTSQKSDDASKVQDALALAKLGEWTAEACLEKPAFIHSQYFLPAIDLLVGGKKENLSLSDVRADVFCKCALFAEQQYQTLMSSEEIKRLQVYTERKTQEIAERKQEIQRASNKKQAQELSGHQRKAEALYAQDTAQLHEFIGARDNYLCQAIEMLSLCLQASDSFDVDAVIRLCSLWFANFKNDVSVVQGTISRVPSRKFVFLAHQLSARLSVADVSNANQSVLQSLLLRMCSEHPFHSLYQVYSLQSSHTDAMSRSRRSSGIVVDGSQADRAEAAFSIFERLIGAPDSSSRSRSVKQLCNSYLEWAKYPIRTDPVIMERRRRKSDKLPIPKHLSILRVKDLRVPVTTANTPLDPSMRYDNCVWILGYQDTFEVAGGINLPKICYCLGSDGTKYKQLFKGEGNDDLRQDAVMEQVFELCNQVLNRDQNTRKRELSIRSYKVIPLAPQAGILEFVGNTRPLQFLVAAHEWYNKSDWTNKECHHRLAQRRTEAQRTLDGAAFKKALVDEFMQIRQHFRPVMRHFFSEHRKEPQGWFEMRLKYSRSVAVNSIVGHILGLGDRHLSNILIDTATGEVVHIDLGIAFEQGKLLPIPERVPFRLTADIVDGFGMSGTDGVFRRCAEETLRVLREGSSVIKTVLEVFKYDPLHSWTMSAMKIRKAQAGTNTSNNNNNHDASDKLGLGTGIGIDLNSGVEDESADRALSSVAKKLDKSLSVEYTVNELISEATDVANLALMFAGWSPHC